MTVVSAADGSADLPRAVAELPSSDLAPRAARRFVSDYLGRDRSADLLDDAALLTTEAVTNAVRYAGPPLSLVVQLQSGTLEIQVHDPSPDAPRHVDAAEDDTSGRGVALVEALADEWGVHQIPGDGKSVWFRLIAA